jgi:hypothetical protein
MNTTPDDVMLALWLDDELEGDEFALVEAWAADKPEQLAAREENRRWRKQFAALVPASEEPPYPDFFNSRIRRAITETAQVETVAQVRKVSWWRAAWWMPTAAVAGMALTFWLGTRVTPPQTASPVVVTPTPVPAISPALYTPDVEVKADYFSSAKAGATVIVLDGVAAIPDDMDFIHTAAVETPNDSDRTALSDQPADSQ